MIYLIEYLMDIQIEQKVTCFFEKVSLLSIQKGIQIVSVWTIAVHPLEHYEPLQGN